MNQNPYKVEVVPGPVAVTFAEDYRIEIAFEDSRTGEVVVDCTGSNAILVSELLSTMPAEALAQLIHDAGPRMVGLVRGNS